MIDATRAVVDLEKRGGGRNLDSSKGGTLCENQKFTVRSTPARWRGDAGSSPLDRARTAASSPSNDLVKNCRVHPAHWLIPHSPRPPGGLLHWPPLAAPRSRPRPLRWPWPSAQMPILCRSLYRSSGACAAAAAGAASWGRRPCCMCSVYVASVRLRSSGMRAAVRH